ncbi:MAG: DUF308 domain-containing protein [Clostridiales bacterium]|nr:DUF308 domain-containing protein [Clostridiales bacterium]
MEIIKRGLLAYLAFAFIFVVVGICFLAWPEASLMTICYILGAITLAWGIVKVSGFIKNKDNARGFLFQLNLVFGIFLIVVGALLLIFPKVIIAAIPIVVGIIITVDGLHKVKVGLDARSMGGEKWWLTEIVALITIIFGLCLILNPFESSNAMIFLLGFALLVDGLQNIIVIVSNFRLMSQIVLPEEMKDIEFKEEDIPTADRDDVETEEIKPEDMIIEEKRS